MEEENNRKTVHGAPNPELIDDENPDWTEADFAKAVSSSGPHVEAHKHPHAHAEKKAGGWKSDVKYVALAGIIYLIIALAMFFTISSNPAHVAPGFGGDSYQNLWDIWWVGFALLKAHTTIFQTGMLFWPIGANLVYQTMSPIGALLSLPFQAISIPFGYNFLFFFGFLLSGIGMYFLADYIVKNKYAAFLAGLFFAFSSFHIAQAYSHIDWMNIGWAPIAIYFLLRMIKERGKAVYYNALGLSISIVLLTFMGDVEQTIMISLVLLGIIIAYALLKEPRRHLLRREFWIALVLAVVLTFILGSWGFIPILTTILHPGGLSTVNSLNTVQYNELWSGDLLSFFLPSFYNGIFNTLAQAYYPHIFYQDLTERVSYIGYVVLALALYGIYKNGRKAWLWIVLALASALMVLGPYVQVWGTLTGIPSLYLLYHAIPALNVVREPGRFNLILTIAMALLAASGFKSISENFKMDRNKVIAAVLVLSLLFLIESNGLPMGALLTSLTTTNASVPPLYHAMANISTNFSILSLPSLPLQNSQTPNYFTGQQSYYAAIAQKPLVGGYVSRENATQELSLYNIPLAVESTALAEGSNSTYQSPLQQNLTNMTLLTLYNYNTAYVTVSKQAYSSAELGELEQYLYNVFGNPIYNDNTTIAFATSNTIDNSLYRGFVGYPMLSQWSVTTVAYNGTTQTLWLPATYGPIIIYAPYPNGTKVQNAIYSQKSYYVNSTITFYALGNSDTQMKLLVTNGNSYQDIATFNITTTMQKYSANITLPSGPTGTELLFETATNESVGMKDIEFSLSKNG
jgi:hypothetical protein